MRAVTIENVSLPVLLLGILAAVVIGGLAGPQLSLDSVDTPSLFTEKPEVGEFMSTHEHFLFFILINDSAYDLRQPVFIEQHPKIHLHANSGTVLHKEATGVTMQFFFRHHPVQLQDSCLRIKNTTRCGELSLYRNGESVDRDTFLYTEVMQADNYIIAINTSQETIDRFSKKYLPEDYETPRRYDGF